MAVSEDSGFLSRRCLHDSHPVTWWPDARTVRKQIVSTRRQSRTKSGGGHDVGATGEPTLRAGGCGEGVGLEFAAPGGGLSTASRRDVPPVRSRPTSTAAWPMRAPLWRRALPQSGQAVLGQAAADLLGDHHLLHRGQQLPGLLEPEAERLGPDRSSLEVGPPHFVTLSLRPGRLPSSPHRATTG